MSAWAARRFWEAAHVEPLDGGGYGVRLDARELRTPSGLALILPSRAMAEAIAQEWNAQEGVIRPLTMPATRAANAAIEKVAPQRRAVAVGLADYGGTDLLCYRAVAPATLVAEQAALWDPYLDWAADRYGARLRPTQGVMPVAQDPGALARLAAPLLRLDAFQLAAMSDLVSLPGSLILGLAVAEGRATAEDAWTAAQLDEDWQARQWGHDAEAERAAAAKGAAFVAAARFYRWSSPD
ncbi:ATPase [Rhodobacteraceae bacterium CCMM004]|nr:ATPase [Rhodobacteraceae bacterium CCMM004]